MKTTIQALRMFMVLTLLTGVGYPILVMVIAQGLFAPQAGGSLIDYQGRVVGSQLIAQSFKDPKYFWPRPSAVDYNPLPSGGSNLGPTSKDLLAKITERKAAGLTGDLLLASASGLDPHVSPLATRQQIARIAAARGFDKNQIQALSDLVDKHTQDRQWGFLGEPRVNVLELNLALEKTYPLEQAAPAQP